MFLTWKEQMFGLFLLIVAIYGFVSCVRFLEDHNVCRTRVVAAVGGCDNAGQCAVRYTDGTDGYELLPIAGKQYDHCGVEF